MPMISAVCHRLIRFAIAREITSCTLIALSTAVISLAISTICCANDNGLQWFVHCFVHCC